MDSKRRENLSSSDYKKKSANFLLPMLDVKMYHRTDKIDYLIDVCFIQLGFPQIVVIFDNIDYEPLKEDIHRFMMNHNFVDAEYGDDDKEICLFFDVPKEYRIDFEFFTQGKYSQFSKKYKDLLISNYGIMKEEGLSKDTGLPNVSMYEAINPSKEIKQIMGKELGVDWRIINEVLDSPNIELEEFKLIDEINE